MLSFQTDETRKKTVICCDAKGMGILLGALAALIADRASHRHLWANYGDLDAGIFQYGVSATEVVIDYLEEL